jgi:ribosomal-protein-alanine N-acetyltransferase
MEHEVASGRPRHVPRRGMHPAVDSRAETILRCGRVLLEPIVPAHADALFDSIQDPRLYTYIPHEPPATREALRARYLRWSARQSADGSESWLNFAVREAASATYVGTVQATLVPGGESQIAYEVFPPFWRRGLASAACEGLLHHVFSSWPVDRLRASCDTRNAASFGLLEKLGFTRVGLVEGADHFKGATSDEYVYEIGRSARD